MPASINNKLLTKFMRNGQPLCACSSSLWVGDQERSSLRSFSHGASQRRSTSAEEASAPPSGTEEFVHRPSDSPLMVDLMAGPNATLSIRPSFLHLLRGEPSRWTGSLTHPMICFIPFVRNVFTLNSKRQRFSLQLGLQYQVPCSGDTRYTRPLH